MFELCEKLRQDAVVLSIYVGIDDRYPQEEDFIGFSDDPSSCSDSMQGIIPVWITAGNQYSPA